MPLNALLALCSATATSWPRPMLAAGYRIEALELPLQSKIGRKVVVDVLYWRADESRLLAGEAKAGANLEAAQAAAYKALEPARVVQAASITVKKPKQPSLQTVYACLREHEDRILIGLAAADLEVPVLSVGHLDVRLIGSRFDDGELAAAFSAPVVVPGPPPAILTIDASSPPDEFDRVLAPTLASCLALRRDDASLDYLCEESVPFHAMYGKPHRSVIRQKVQDAARRAALADPETFDFQPETNTRSARLRFLRTPEDADPRGRTQGWRAQRARLSGARSRTTPSDINPVFEIFEETPLDLERELEAAAGDETDDGGEEEEP